MEIIFPESWNGLSDPYVRSELIEYLKDARECRGQVPSYDDLNFLVHFIFDDYGFGKPSLADMIGGVFFDETEVRVIEEFVKQLDHAIGPKTKKLDEVSLDDWGPAAEAADSAFEKLIARGQAVFEA